MASPTQQIWVRANSRSQWWTGRPGMLQSMQLQRVRHDWATELNWIMNDVEHLFMCLVAICMSSLKKCLFRSFSHFLIVLFFFFWYWVVWAACIFWKLILCQLFHLLLFLPSWGLSFHLAYSFLCCTKAFKFNQVPFVYFCFYFHFCRRWVIEDLVLIYVIECSASVFL